jgi:hypothetical protein
MRRFFEELRRRNVVRVATDMPNHCLDRLASIYGVNDNSGMCGRKREFGENIFEASSRIHTASRGKYRAARAEPVLKISR